MLKLAEIFTDHMVLARDRECIIWGESAEYSVEAFLDGKKTAETVFGEFEMRLPAQPAGGPHVLEIVAGHEKITLEDVWFGEVWLAGGQSNMEFLLSSDGDYEEAKKIADVPMLRQFSVPKAQYKTHRSEHPELFEKAPEWVVATPETCGGFSDLCFWYGRKFVEEYKIPVGIVYCNYGGSSASSWVSRYTAAVNPVVHEYIEDYERDLKGLSFNQYVKKHDDYYAYDRAWHEKAENLIATEGLDAKTAYSDPRIGECPSWPPPHGPWHFGSPCHLYESMLTTIIPYSLTQVLWYQGEEDVPHAGRYKELLKAMIEEWRRDFRDLELPFVLIQIAPYSYDWNDSLKTDAAVVREADVVLSHEMNKVSFVVTTDSGEKFDIHPNRKRALGERIFEQDKARILGGSRVKSAELLHLYRGCAEFEGRIFAEFDAPLRENLEITGFQLKTADGRVVPTGARTLRNENTMSFAEYGFDAACTVEIEAAGMDIIEVRYAFADYIESSLYGENGLPATPFCKEITVAKE